jgi:hypothetical protein
MESLVVVLAMFVMVVVPVVVVLPIFRLPIITWESIGGCLTIEKCMLRK